MSQTEVDKAKFRSSLSTLDYDVVLWDPASAIREYRREPWSGEYRGRPCLDDDESARIVEDVKRRRGEFTAMLDLGRTLVVFAAPSQQCYVATGQKTTSGTGKNARVTRIVDDIDVLAALPLKVTSVAAAGTQMQLRAGEPFSTFWRSVNDLLGYRAYFDVQEASPLAVIDRTDKVVGAVARVSKGLVVLLPAPWWDTSFAEHDWAEEEETRLVSAIRDLVDALLQESGNFKLPEWSSSYLLPGERERTAELRTREVERDALLKEVDRVKEVLGTLGQRKILFTGSGAALETQVQAAFRALGFTVTAAAPGRDDLIATRGDTIAVVEVKGVSKSAAEKHAAQLEKWVSGFYEANGRQPKGILVVNTFADSPLERRTGADFPSQMLPYSAGRGHALVTGLQLLGAWLDVEAHPDRQTEISVSLLGTVGVWERYADWRTFLGTDEARTTASAAQPSTGTAQESD